MSRRLLPFLIAPPLALIVLAVFGNGTAAAVVGVVIAGLLGGAAAWLAFGRAAASRPRSAQVEVETSATGIRVVPIAQNGDRSPRNEAETRALVHLVG